MSPKITGTSSFSPSEPPAARQENSSSSPSQRSTHPTDTRFAGLQTRPPQGAAVKTQARIQAFADKTRFLSGAKVQNKMIKTGEVWQEQEGIDSFTSVKAQSKKNLSTLRQQLTPLTEDESAFVEKFLTAPLFITHATERQATIDSPDRSVSLLSRQKLTEKGANFAKDHTNWGDRHNVASHDNVFFALEAGAEPQKPASRFGDRLLRFPFDQPRILAAATLHIEDPEAQYPSSAEGRFQAIEKYPDENCADSVKEKLDDRELNPLAEFFHGGDMKVGLALSIVAACRSSEMPDDMKKEMLGATDLNSLINGLFRPTIMVPKSFVGTPSDDVAIRHQVHRLARSFHPEDMETDSE
ncbi:hypothetical protein ACVBGC_24710 [Burkholderia stagnalis]